MNHPKGTIPLLIMLCSWACIVHAQEPLLTADGIAIVDYYKVPAVEEQVALPKTRYDYTDFAKQLTTGCTDNYQKIKAIYKWICDSITYDTSFRIQDADACMEARKGTCRGYCGLFYLLAKAVGVRVEIINGMSRDSNGNVDPSGHAWLFAYTRENHGILLDPTWGAGIVRNGNYSRCQNCWLWFNVHPEWMILSHFPKNRDYQLLPQPMSTEEFYSIIPVSDLWMEYGLDVLELAKEIRAKTLTLPTFFSQGEGAIDLLKMPLRRSLKIGEFYDFRIRMKSQRAFSIINEKTYCHQEEWTDEGDSIFSVRFMPRETPALNICLRDVSNPQWNIIVRYDIEQPTAEDWEKVTEAYPEASPLLKNITNLNYAKWKQAGIDGHQLLKMVQEQHITEVPLLFDSQGQRLRIVSVPMTKQLNVDTPYTFSFYPESGVKWAIVNAGTWYYDWDISPEGLYTMTVTPVEGPLFLYVKMDEESSSYWTCLQYEVK